MFDNVDSILEMIQYIEQHLYDEITLEQISEHFHYSQFHFARMFKEIVGENLGDYQLKRRLTVAAILLQNSEKGILEIALMCGYQSQEAFTRMFKAYFNITPRAYRLKQFSYLNLYKYPLTHNDIVQMLSEYDQPEFHLVHKDAFVVTGLFYHGTNQKHDVARVFNLVVQKMHFEKIYNQIDGLYGLDLCKSDGKQKSIPIHSKQRDASHLDINHQNVKQQLSLMCDIKGDGVDGFDFVAGIDQQYMLPQDMTDRDFVHMQIPENDYAVFELTPMIEKIPQQVRAIYLSFLGNREYQLTDNYGFEFYPKGFLPNHKKLSAYLYLPVIKRKQD